MDVLVLGAGSVGAAAAAHLAGRGLAVGLVESRAPARQTSFGNTGVIDGAGYIPHPFPREIGKLIGYMTGRTPHARTQWSHVPAIAGWLWAYFKASSPAGIADAAARLAPLCAHAVSEHRALAEAAGTSGLLRDGGFMNLFRTKAGLESAAGDIALLQRYGGAHALLDEAGLHAEEPHLKPGLTGALWIQEGWSTSDPGSLVASYVDLATKRGTRLVAADARRLFRAGGRWVLPTETGTITAEKVVVALGPWAKEFLAPFGINVPIEVKRGYHMHFGTEGNATLQRPFIDVERGYCLTPMARGHRLTTGAEFAPRDAPKNPAQIDACEPLARELFAIAERRDPEPWMGARPNTPDGVPIIDAAPGQPGMVLAVGHGHWGLSLGPATGRLVADLVTGGTPLVDPEALGIERFG